MSHSLCCYLAAAQFFTDVQADTPQDQTVELKAKSGREKPRNESG